jgi:hypothetical protein
LTTNDVDDGSQVGPVLDQMATSVASFTADGAYDQDRVSAAVIERHPGAVVIVPPRSTAVPSEMADTAPTQRDRHLRFIAEHGRAWTSMDEHGRAWTSGLAESIRVHHPGPSRGHRWQVQNR